MVDTLTSGVCTIWTNSAAVSGMYSSVRDAVIAGNLSPSQLDQACAQASDLLYVLSGRQYPGLCERTMRPTARPLSWTTRDWAQFMASVNGELGFSHDWGTCIGGLHDSCRNPPQIDLKIAPIIAVNQVKIDGQVIPSDEYRIDNNRLLVRVRPTLNATPSVRWGWPTCQNLDLPDSEIGTFSVDVTYGMSPPSSAVGAAQALASELAMAHADQPNRLPVRLTQITRQGVSMAVMDPMQFLDKGLTGVYEADMFIRSANPSRQRRKPRVYSRDTGYTRTQGR